MRSGAVSHLIGLCIFFLVLTSVVVALRLWVRLRIKKSAFGWDDIFLFLTYIGFILFLSFAGVAYHYGVASYDSQPWHDPTKANSWTHILNDTCMIISGTVKISVALVIYRLLDHRPLLQAIIIMDILTCSIFTIVTSVMISVGCSDTSISAYTFRKGTCEKTWYAQQSSSVIIVVFHVLFPVALFWNVQIRNGAKSTVIILFSLGLLSAIAVIFKLDVIVDYFNATDKTDYRALWIRAMTWATVEHGTSLSAASILTLRPVCRPAIERYKSFSGSISRTYSSRRDSLKSRRSSLATLVSGHKCSVGTDSRKPSLPTLEEAMVNFTTTTAVATSYEAKNPSWNWGQKSSTFSPTAGPFSNATGQRIRSASYDRPESPGDAADIKESTFGAASRDTPDFSNKGLANGHRRTLAIDEHLRALEPVYAAKGGGVGLAAQQGSPSGRNWFDDRRWSHAAEDDYV